jgi:UDP-N-acetylmuramate dehydrogenase
MIMQTPNLKNIKGIHCHRNQPLSRYTSMQVGGAASFIVEPEDKKILMRLLTCLREEMIPWYLLGGGTNTIFDEEGFQGVVIKLGKGFRFVLQKPPFHLQVGTATPLSLVLEKSLDLGLAGLEFCLGIPGTLGGAVEGNAGMDGWGIHDFISLVEGVTERGEEVAFHRGEYSYGYRHVEWPFVTINRSMQERGIGGGHKIIVTSVDLELGPADPEKQKALLEKYRRIRLKQPATRRTAGSIFKNPSGDYAGRLIEAAGLKGRTIGGACISSSHGNWIINKGNASAHDVISLISMVQKTVRKKFGILLEPEVHIISHQRLEAV